MKTIPKTRRVFVAALAAGAMACGLDRSTSPSIRPPDESVTVPAGVTSALDASGACSDCRVGPETFIRQNGQPQVYSRTFSASAGQLFVVDLDDLGSQGADASVKLNGAILLAPRGAGEASARHYRETVVVQSQNTLEVRLVGKPGSMLRVAVWLFRPVTIEVSLPPNSHLEIGGPQPVQFETTVTNHTTVTLTRLHIISMVRQASAERAGGSFPVAGCDGPGETLPPGSCVIPSWIDVRNWTGGHGTLVPGPAVAVFTLYDENGNALATHSVPVFLEEPRG